jgi:glycosyltransferase involved in cell wall biosynthesis
MRILYHHRTLADGAEGIHIAEMVGAFRALGHEVRVLGLAAGGGSRSRWASSIKRALPGTAFEAAAIASNLAEYVEVRRAIGGFQPDLLYKRHARHDVGAVLAACHADVRVVLEVNCLFTGQRYKAFEPTALDGVAQTMERRVLRRADVVLAVSTPLAGDIEAMAGVHAIVLPNGADPVTFDPERAHPESIRARYGLAGLVIGWVGVLRDWHGLDLLLEALAGLKGATLLVVGDGPARPAVEARAAALGVFDRLVFTGRIPHESMRDHMAALDIAVVAADRTGVASPMKLLEYMAMARAVVAPDIANIRDVATDGRDALLFAEGDSVALLRALTRLADDAVMRDRIGGQARATILGSRTWRSNAERVVSLVARSAMPDSRQVAGAH